VIAAIITMVSLDICTMQPVLVEHNLRVKPSLMNIVDLQ